MVLLGIQFPSRRRDLDWAYNFVDVEDSTTLKPVGDAPEHFSAWGVDEGFSNSHGALVLGRNDFVMTADPNNDLHQFPHSKRYEDDQRNEHGHHNVCQSVKRSFKSLHSLPFCCAAPPSRRPNAQRIRGRIRVLEQTSKSSPMCSFSFSV